MGIPRHEKSDAGVLRMKLLIFGPQGSGKGTQAEKLAKKLGIDHVSTGELLRKHVREKTELGKKVEVYMNKGVLVPPELNIQVLQEGIGGKKGFILDGFPRNTEQAESLNYITDIDKAILLEVPDEISIKRISGRRVCGNGHEYHVKFLPPKVEGICDIDGLPLKKRSDDEEDAIKQRLKIYHESTEPVIRHYEDQGKLVRINGDQSIDEVFKEIQKKLNI